MDVRKKLDEIKELWGFDTDLELAKKLETAKHNIDSWVKRGKIPEKWEWKIGQMSTNVNGNHNIVTSGANNVISNNSASKPHLQELFDLIEQYATPKTIEEFREKLLRIKEVVDG